MPKLIKASEADSGEYASFQRDALEPTITTTAHEVPVLDPREEREAILAEARALAEQRVREAYAEGLRRGEAAGREQFEQSLAECREALAAASAAVTAAHEEFLDSLEPQVVRLAQAIASHLVQREVQCDNELTLRTARRAIESLAERKRLVVRFHPKDLEAMRHHRVTLLDEFEGIEGLELIADDTVGPGGCVAESETLHADARLDVQIERVLQNLLESP